MKTFLAAALAFALAASPALAHDPGQVAQEVRQADLAFAERAKEAGPAAAFAEFMDPEEGLKFGMGDNPARGRAAIFASMGGPAPVNYALDWVPTDAWGSRGGDIGVTTGDWRVIPNDAEKPIRTGRYVTVWRKNTAGEWKGLIDIGQADSKARENALGPLPER